MARPLNDSPYLYGLHDPGGEHIMAQQGVPGWVLFTEALGNDPGNQSGADYSRWADQGFGIIVRLNNGYEPNGTIPPASRYTQFAQRCANFVRSSRGCHIWIIGNEMNFAVERPGVSFDRSVNPPRIVNPGEVILPTMYANCYRQCRTAIKGVSGHQNDQVIVGGVAPWNPQTQYEGNPNGDWVKYLQDILNLLGPSNCDGISIHTYTHGWDPNLIHTDAFMNPPFQNRQYNFRAYRDFMGAIPAGMRRLPVYLTETDEDEAWRNENVGWVQRAYGEIDWWNHQAGNQLIRAVILYRWPNVDRWGIDGKAGVIEDFRQAMVHKYEWESLVTTQPTVPTVPEVPVTPTPPTPPTPTTPPAVPDTSPIRFDPTGKTAKGLFAAFYRKYGLDVTGYPMTEEYVHADSGLKTQDWQRLTMEEFEGKVRLRLTGQEASDLRAKVKALGEKIALLERTVERLQSGAGGPAEPAMTDITTLLPRNAEGFVKRATADIQHIVISHTAVQPEVGAERVAQAQRARYPGIVGQYFITGAGQIQQTNPINEVVVRDQAWIYNGINIYVAGNFDETVPADAQLDALARLVAWLLFHYNLPESAIKGAGEHIVTRSPGLQWLQGQRWKDLLLARVRVVPSGPLTPPVDSSELAALRTQVNQLRAQLAELQGHLSAAEEQRSLLEQQRAVLIQQMAQLEQNQTQLEQLWDRLVQEKAALTAEIEILRQSGSGGGTGGPPEPDSTDITSLLPRNADGFIKRQTEDIQSIVINHTGVRPEVGADRVAQAQRARYPGIVGQYFITGDGQIQQTNPIDEVVIRDQAWIYNGINIYVAGNFDETVPTDAQQDALARLVAWLMHRYNIPEASVKGVGEHIVTRSPGLQWLQGQRWKDLLLARVRAVPSESLTPCVDSSELAALRTQVNQLQGQLAELQPNLTQVEQQRDALQAQRDQLQARLDAFGATSGTGRVAQPAFTDLALQLPRKADALKARSLDQIKTIVFNHTAVDPNVTVERLAAAHQSRWGAILYQYVITGDGSILQTNGLTEVVDLTQPWIAQGVNIAVAGNFSTSVPTPDQINAAAALTAWLMQEHGISAENVKGASELMATQSPGTQWLQGQRWKDTLLAAVADVQQDAATGAPGDSAVVAALRAQVSQIQVALNQAQTKITALQQERDKLLAQLNNQSPNLAELTQRVTTLTQEIAGLNSQVQTLTTDKTNLTRQVQTLTGEKTTLTGQVTTLTGQVAAANQEKQTLTSRIAVLEQRIKQLEAGGSTGPRELQPPEIVDLVDRLPKHATLKYDTRALSKITHIAIHHSAAPANITPERIAAYHVGKDWPGMGYHFYVQADGVINQTNRLETVSYQVYNNNAYSIGISIAGNFVNGAIPTPKQIEQVGHLVAWLMKTLNIPLQNIMGHKEFPQNATSCPGSDWNTGQNWKKMIQERVKEVQAGVVTAPAGKALGHYVLFWQNADSWAQEDWAAATNYFGRFRPTAGFSPADARNAEYVTIVGGVAGVSYQTEQMLISSGVKVERLAGADFNDTKRMLDELASSGRRFKTFSA